MFDYLGYLLSKFSNGLQHCDGYTIRFYVICESELSVKYF